MGHYRKKPIVIEAFRFDGGLKSYREVFYALGEPENFYYVEVGTADGDTTEVEIETLEGNMRGQPGDWIIKGVKGELYPCKPDIFAATYEPANQATSAEEKEAT